jgi:hypothetical protein
MTRIIFLLLLVILSTSCDTFLNLKDYENFSANKVLKVDQTPITNIPADGVSEAVIKAELSREAALNKRTVVFLTSKGFFQGGKGDSLAKEIDSNFVASASLSSVHEVTATVNFKVQNRLSTFEKKISFVKAFPTTIIVKVDSFAVPSNYKGETLITAYLKTANGGVPTSGHPVNFSVSAPGIDPFGDFLNQISVITTNSEGKASVRYNPGKTVYEGYVTISASTLKADGTREINSTKIFIKTP